MRARRGHRVGLGMPASPITRPRDRTVAKVAWYSLNTKYGQVPAGKIGREESHRLDSIHFYSVQSLSIQTNSIIFSSIWAHQLAISQSAAFMSLVAR